jgi:hypothetical protein
VIWFQVVIGAKAEQVYDFMVEIGVFDLNIKGIELKKDIFFNSCNAFSQQNSFLKYFHGLAL